MPSFSQSVLSAIHAEVRASVGWRVHGSLTRTIEAVPVSLADVLPPIGTRNDRGLRDWLALHCEIQAGNASLGVFWRASEVNNVGIRNAVLEALLRDPRTGFVYKGSGDDWKGSRAPTFSGERFSDSWWPRGQIPNLSRGAAMCRDLMTQWTGRLPAMIDAARPFSNAVKEPPGSAALRVGQLYSRDDVRELLGIPLKKGGPWFTGYVRHRGEWFLFPNIETEARTGHRYNNRWEGGRFIWFGKTTTTAGQAEMRALTAPGAVVHLFTRRHNRDDFEYVGRVTAAASGETKPVRVEWVRWGDPDIFDTPLPEESLGPQVFTEGRVRTITIDARERDPRAREACIRHWGLACAVCGMRMEERYGPVASTLIHVHHLSRMADADGEREVDPVRDLRPVCPNCHAVVHLRNPEPFSIEEVRAMLKNAAE